MIGFSDDAGTFEMPARPENRGIEWNVESTKSVLDEKPNDLSEDDLIAALKIVSENKNEFSLSQIDTLQVILYSNFKEDQILTEDEIKVKQIEEDSKKTPEQIMQEVGVTPEEYYRVFEKEFVAMEKHPSQLSKEELKQKIRESGARLRKHVQIKNPESEKMPSDQEITEMYVKQASSVKDNSMLSSILDAMEFLQSKNVNEYPPKKQEKPSIAIEDLKNIISDLINIAEFDAKKARALWLEQLQKRSNLSKVLAIIKGQAMKGEAKVSISHLCQYDRIKLAELGFSVKLQNETLRAYDVSWE